MRLGHYRQAMTMVLPYSEKQALLCNNNWWHQSTSSSSEWSAQATVHGQLLLLIMIIDIDRESYPGICLE